MHVRTKKALASSALAISLGALALGVAGINPALATSSGEPPTPEITDGVSTTTVESSTETVPWCGWFLSGVDESVSLVPIDDPETDENETADPDVNLYDGSAILIGDSDSNISLFVNGDSSYSDEVDNCSWYGDPNKQEVWVSVAASEINFVAVSNSPLALEELTRDESMDFALQDGNPLNLNVDPDDSCVSVYGFAIDAGASIYDTDSLESYPVKSNSEAEVGTTDTCTWTVDYVTSIPSALVPKYGGSIYTYTGPLLTTTLEVQ